MKTLPTGASMSMKPDGSGVEIWFEPRMELVGTIRVFLSDFVLGIASAADVAGRVEIATQELVENAVRTATRGVVQVQLEIKRDPHGARVRTTNWASRWNIACLKRAVDEVTESEASPQALYVKLMQRAAGRVHGSGLGIGRIYAEAEMNVRYEIDGDRVTVVAETAIGRQSAP